MSDYKDFDPKQAEENRKKEMDEIMGKLESGVASVTNSEEYRKLMDTIAKFPRYSINNNILIMLQRPDATLGQSFTGWKEMNRFVKKGEKGIRILAPAPYKIEKEQDKIGQDGKPVLDQDGEPVKETVQINVNAFKPVSTFDISQTEGEPLPQIGVTELDGNVEGYSVMLDAIKLVSPVPIEFENIESGAKGYFHLAENRIAIQEGMSEVQTVKTAIHEMAHQKLHSVEAQQLKEGKQSRASKEVEAESVAYVVCKHFGIDTSDYSFSYVAGWSEGKKTPELKESLQTIRRAASEMITSLEDKFLELNQILQEQRDENPFEQANEDPVRFIRIIPPEPLHGTDRPIKITMEQPKETRAEDKEKASEKKSSVKDKLKNEKKLKENKPKKDTKKNLQEAI